MSNDVNPWKVYPRVLLSQISKHCLVMYLSTNNYHFVVSSIVDAVFEKFFT